MIAARKRGPESAQRALERLPFPDELKSTVLHGHNSPQTIWNRSISIMGRLIIDDGRREPMTRQEVLRRFSIVCRHRIADWFNGTVDDSDIVHQAELVRLAAIAEHMASNVWLMAESLEAP